MRRPGLYELLRQSGELNGPTVDQVCPTIRFVTPEGEALAFRFGDLREIRFMVAGKGDEIGSSFGHPMLGLRTCPQENQHCSSTSSEFLEADYSDFVAGFVAKTIGTYSIVGGLRGSYPTQVSFNFAANIKRKYLYDDFRSLVSVPLQFNEDQKRLFVYLLEVRFWLYNNHYKFLSNNCASEVLKLLKLVLPNGNPLDHVGASFLTPMGLMKKLIKIGVADNTRREDFAKKVPDVEQYIKNVIGRRSSLAEYFEIEPLQRRTLYLRSQANLNLNPKLNADRLQQQWKLLEKAALRELASHRDALLWDWLNPKKETKDHRESLLCYRQMQKAAKSLTEDPLYFSPRLVPGDYVPSLQEIVPSDLKQKALITARQLMDQMSECAALDPELSLNKNYIDIVKSNLQMTLAN